MKQFIFAIANTTTTSPVTYTTYQHIQSVINLVSNKVHLKHLWRFVDSKIFVPAGHKLIDISSNNEAKLSTGNVLAIAFIL